MPSVTQNPNLERRPGPGLLAWALAPALKPLLFLLRRPASPGPNDAPVTVFEAYMVGDFFMALPALNLLKKSARARGASLLVLCRPDCVALLAREGMTGVPFVNDFRVRPGFASFRSTWRSAWSLRGRLGDVALDLDADPRTAFWLKVAGARRVVSYRRAFGILFDQTFRLPEPSVHQADRDLRVVEEFLKTGGRRQATGGREHNERILSESIPNDSLDPTAYRLSPDPSSPWILSVWTRKASKNWPLDRWEALLEKLVAEDVLFAVLDAPDGDAAFRAFQARWKGRAAFLRGSLDEVDAAVRASRGVIATDNFLGHMGGYHGKPVLWINRCSPAAQVEPRGPFTRAVPPHPGNPTVDEVWAAFQPLRER
jgi:ADP-heptose:LPS heptosyltransferase